MLAAGHDALNPPPDGVEEKVAHQASPAGMGMVAQALAWPALLRKLDRVSPGYRD
jgi:hypothetical protein